MFHLNSFGGRLFWLIILSTLGGMGGMACFFSELLKGQAEEQVRSSLAGKVNEIASVAEIAETLAYGLGVSATTLHERQAQYADTYREIVLQLFERRPEFVVGLGLGQSENGIIVDQSWMFPYYSAILQQDNTAFNQDAIRYEDLADDKGEFYPQSQRYQSYFLPQISIWTEPYEGPDNNRLLTYYLPMFGNEGEWLGTTLVDIDGNYLNRLLDDAVFRRAGHFLLITSSGMVIADPTDAYNQPGTQRDIEELRRLWEKGVGGTGFLRSATGYWAYNTVPGQDWILLGFVPYSAVYDRIFTITAVTTTLVMAALTIILFLAISKLNRRLKPILLQCNQLPINDSKKNNFNLLAEWHHQDELDRLSLCFFKILEQLNENDETILYYKQALSQETQHTNQVIEQVLELTTRVDNEAREQQVLIQEVQNRLTDKDDQSVDIHIDALSTMERALDGDLRRLSADVNATELFTSVEAYLANLSVAIDNGAVPNGTHLQVLMARLTTDIAHLKAHEQKQQTTLKKLNYQTSNILQAGQTALSSSRSMFSLVNSIMETLFRLEAISSNLNSQVKFISEMILVNLEQRRKRE
ncbi:cache domain-containing protein [Leptothoe sp. PORK10 BA2]|nr:cache domain-containing protein [Leptothoe sp. PORK10 BA2]